MDSTLLHYLVGVSLSCDGSSQELHFHQLWHKNWLKHGNWLFDCVYLINGRSTYLQTDHPAMSLLAIQFVLPTSVVVVAGGRTHCRTGTWWSGSLTRRNWFARRSTDTRGGFLRWLSILCWCLGLGPLPAAASTRAPTGSLPLSRLLWRHARGSCEKTQHSIDQQIRICTTM